MYALAAYGFWGFSPIYFKWVQHVPALEVLGHRVIWSMLLLLVLLWLGRRWSDLRLVLFNFSQLRWLLLSAALISVNWLIYIFAIQDNRILEASLGYYINPLVSVLLGMLFFRETLRRTQVIAILLAAAGTAWLTFGYGSLPWVSLALALTFAFYGLVRKLAPAGPMVGLFVETLLVAPIALLYLGWLDAAGQATLFHTGWRMDLTLIGAGIVTTLPLLWFTNGAKRLPLSAMGLFQYLAPSLQFLLAVFLYGETFTRTHAISFGLIWLALVIYSTDTVRVHRRQRVLRDAMGGNQAQESRKS